MAFEVVPFQRLFLTPQKNGLTRPKRVRGAGLPMVNMGELFAHSRISNVEMDLVSVSDKERDFLLEADDLLFARQSLVLEGAGQCSLFVGNSQPTVFESHIIRCRLDKDIVEPRFYYYFFRSSAGRKAIETIVEQGAGASGIRGSDLAKLEVPCPPRVLQREIAATLSALDDHIDTLCQVNATLEAIAKTLFKSWFVDFDGVPPEDMQESELGLIPKRWRVATIGEVASVIDCLHAKKPELLAEGRPYLQLNCIRDDGLLESSSAACISNGDYAKWTSRIEAQPGDCVITNVGRVGALAQIPDGFKAAIGRNMTAIRPNKDFAPTFMIELLLSDFMRREIDGKTDAGTILSALNVKSIPKLRFVLPEEPILRRFEETARPLRAAMEANLQHSYTLAALRNTLSPRLIAGKLRVGVSERIAEESA